MELFPLVNKIKEESAEKSVSNQNFNWHIFKTEVKEEPFSETNLASTSDSYTSSSQTTETSSDVNKDLEEIVLEDGRKWLSENVVGKETEWTTSSENDNSHKLSYVDNDISRKTVVQSMKKELISCSLKIKTDVVKIIAKPPNETVPVTTRRTEPSSGTDKIVHKKSCSYGDRVGKSIYKPESNNTLVQEKIVDFQQVRNKVADMTYLCGMDSQAYVRSHDSDLNKSGDDTGKKPFKCDICHTTFTRIYSLSIHKRKHTGEKPYKCEMCGAAFTISCLISAHLRSHTGEKPYRCGICGAAFTRFPHLAKHRRTHIDEKPYKCDTCEAAFVNSYSLTVHKRKHTVEKPYKCDICKSAFTNLQNLEYHILAHIGWKCDKCEAVFIRNYDLSVHKRTHTGDKPYKCHICKAAFTQSSSFTVHKRTHTGEKPFKCHICKVAFTQSFSLTVHKRTHTGEKPYKCDKCEAAYTNSRNLKYHKLSHTGGKPFRCRFTIPKILK